MAFTEHQQRIADSMNRLMRKIDRTSSNWYVGVTKNPRKRMEQHKRKYSKLAYFTYYQTYSKDSACKIEKHFSMRPKIRKEKNCKTHIQFYTMIWLKK